MRVPYRARQIVAQIICGWFKEQPIGRDRVSGRVTMKLLRLCLTVSVVLAAPGAALAQVDYSASKSAPQLFSSDCSACHQSPQGLAKGRDASALSSFLREHYTTGGASAGRLASYLASLPAGRQPAARGSQATGATATAPAGGTPRPPAAVEAERTKPDEARKAKPAATEAEREPAKPTAVDPLSTKLRGYATTGEAAMPVVAAAPPDAARAVSPPAPADAAKPAEARPAPSESAPGPAPSASESAPAAPAQSGEPTQSRRPPG
jgi:hypothetical protein